jgi:ATP-dependent Zn protease
MSDSPERDGAPEPTAAGEPPVDVVTAYHEAGHAVLALLLGRPVHRVSVRANHLRLGLCEFKPGAGRPADDVLERDILILLGGLAAEARFTGKYDWDAAGHDLQELRDLVDLRARNDKQADRLERRMLDKTEHLLDRPGVWEATERIAQELVRKTTISGRQARHLFEEAVSRAARR